MPHLSFGATMRELAISIVGDHFPEVSMEQKQDATEKDIPAKYEAPSIEEIVTPKDVAREVHYAGIQGPSNPAN